MLKLKIESRYCGTEILLNGGVLFLPPKIHLLIISKLRDFPVNSYFALAKYDEAPYLYTMITIQELKENKSEIVKIITEQVGAEMVKPVMEQMLKGADCCDSIEELIENAIYMATQFEVRVEKSRYAFILGRLEQIEIENN